MFLICIASTGPEFLVAKKGSGAGDVYEGRALTWTAWGLVF